MRCWGCFEDRFLSEGRLTTWMWFTGDVYTHTLYSSLVTPEVTQSQWRCRFHEAGTGHLAQCRPRYSPSRLDQVWRSISSYNVSRRLLAVCDDIAAYRSLIFGSVIVIVSELPFRWGRAVEIWVITIDHQLLSTTAVLCGILSGQQIWITLRSLFCQNNSALQMLSADRGSRRSPSTRPSRRPFPRQRTHPPQHGRSVSTVHDKHI